MVKQPFLLQNLIFNLLIKLGAFKQHQIHITGLKRRPSLPHFYAKSPPPWVRKSMGGGGRYQIEDRWGRATAGTVPNHFWCTM